LAAARVLCDYIYQCSIFVRKQNILPYMWAAEIDKFQQILTELNITHREGYGIHTES
jgi:hypothetical protein